MMIESYQVFIIGMIAFLVVGFGSVIYIQEITYSTQQAMSCQELYDVVVGESDVDPLFLNTKHAYQIYEVKCD